MSVFDKWNKNIDKDFMSDLDAQERGEGGFEKVPYDVYEVKINKMELKESKTHKPMLSIQFKILAGTYKGKLIYMNQVVETPYQIHLANDFLRSLDTDIEIKFKDYDQYNELVLNVAEAIDTDKLEYALMYDIDEKNYDTFEITDVFSTEE